MSKKKVVIILDSDSDEDATQQIVLESIPPRSSSQSEKKRRRPAPRPSSAPVRKKARTSRPLHIIDSDEEDFLPVKKPLRLKPNKLVPATPAANKFQINGQRTGSSGQLDHPSDILGAPARDLWTDKYAARSERDLPVRNAKVAEVKSWLSTSLINLPLDTPRTPRILILTGPSGACKTTMVTVLAKEMRAEICEWIDPSLYLWKDADDKIAVPYSSRLDAFRAFMLRCERYSSIPGDRSAPASAVASAKRLTARKLILLEQIPYLHDQKQKREFNEVLQDFLKTSRFPMAMVVSDEQSGSSSLHRLLEPETLSSPLVNIININAVGNPTVTRCLKSICQSERAIVPADVIEKISESAQGDIRSAVNTLQFYCRQRASQSGKQKGKGGQKSSSGSLRLSGSSERDSSALLESRDTSYSLFHAVGKICHNKREKPEQAHATVLLLDDEGEEEVEDFTRDPLTFVPEEVFKTVQIAPPRLNAFMHENYLSFFSTIDEVARAAEYLSDADFLDGHLHHPYRNDGKINTYLTSVAARGLLFSNKSVKPHKFQPIYKPLLFQAEFKRKDMTRLVDHLFVRGSASTELRRQSAFLSPTRSLHLDVLPYLKHIIQGAHRDPLGAQLTGGQKKALAILNSFSSDFRRSTVGKSESDDGSASEGRLIRELTQQCYSQHTFSTSSEQAEADLLLQIGGAFNEVLKEDAIEDFD